MRTCLSGNEQINLKNGWAASRETFGIFFAQEIYEYIFVFATMNRTVNEYLSLMIKKGPPTIFFSKNHLLTLTKKIVGVPIFSD